MFNSTRRDELESQDIFACSVMPRLAVERALSPPIHRSRDEFTPITPRAPTPLTILRRAQSPSRQALRSSMAMQSNDPQRHYPSSRRSKPTTSHDVAIAPELKAHHARLRRGSGRGDVPSKPSSVHVVVYVFNFDYCARRSTMRVAVQCRSCEA
ncbi:hypothetical protein FA95DRAFT_1021429 [Auriscalpium vulgare]|uniref:Uncharacterized protein n=1 Tax=Auriscalpium vulgare TaxID=40419 RepID=A0ACB8R6A5_9AGAM|nr:hypothetical protein FA95DRAFT_1021429 [Auriscalpium vulgare]